MSASPLILQARSLLAADVATEIAQAYTDQPIFPERELVVGANTIPDWQGEVLLISVENQGVCSWGLALDGDAAGSVVVGGDLRGGEHTQTYCSDLEAFVRTRLWDAACLGDEMLLQAQAAPLD